MGLSLISVPSQTDVRKHRRRGKRDEWIGMEDGDMDRLKKRKSRGYSKEKEGTVGV